MKKLMLFAALAAVLVSCGAKPVKTIENLKAAITGESNASAKYAAYSQRAMEEGRLNAANLFAATSKAEAIHAANHTKVLADLGVIDFTPVIEDIVVDSTYNNLLDAQNGEKYEFETMYPEFIKVAQEEKCMAAQNSFSWANDAEIKHAALYEKAMIAIASQSEEVIVPMLVCTNCGDTFAVSDAAATCAICGMGAELFITFPDLTMAPAVAEADSTVAAETTEATI